MQTAIRYPDRVSALVLVVPIAYKPWTAADSAPAVSDNEDILRPRLPDPDFLVWAALHVARDSLIRHVTATPPEQVTAANIEAPQRVNDMANRILPVSRHTAALRSDKRLGKSAGPFAL